MENSTKKSKDQKSNKGKEKPQKTENITFMQLFKYADKSQKILAVFAFILACCHGVMMPLFSVIFGQITKDFTPENTPEERRTKAKDTAIIMILIGAAAFVIAGGGVSLWKYIGSKIAENLKKAYYKKILEQEMGWFDIENPEKLTTNYSEEMAAFAKGCGQSIHLFLYASSMSISGILIGFFIGWYFSLLILLTIPLMFAGMGAFIAIQAKSATATKKNYAEAGSISEQVFQSVKTVYSLNGQEHEIDHYGQTLLPAKKASIRFGRLAAICFGIFFFVIFFEYGFGFWIGAQLVKKEVYNGNSGSDYDAGDIISVFFAVVTGAFSLGQVAPAAESIAKGREAGHHIYKLIERVPEIKIDDPSQKKVDHLKGEIEFKNVSFSYPSRKNVLILNNLSFKIKSGQKVAFVGETGCGKSTTVQLVERYYEADSGQVLVDGVNIKDYNLSSYRSLVGYVGQEPKLFAMSIKENLMICKPDATEEELVHALKLANAYDFVMNLENKMDTYVGSGGSQLSGGQKQRIGIARSALQNPKILLLDESTSALDRKNEREIQATLDKFSENRTTITIAHRLSTIRNSDIIFVLNKGSVMESGSHDELLAKKGAYSRLVQVQVNHEENQKKMDHALEEIDHNEGEIKENTSHDTDMKNKIGVRHDSSIKLNKVSDRSIDTSGENSGKTKSAGKRLRENLAGSWGMFFVACFFSIINGALLPFFALFLADMIDLLSKYDGIHQGIDVGQTEAEISKDVNITSLMFLVMAIISFIANFVQLNMFNIIGERVTFKLRTQLFKSLVNKDMAFFDHEKHNSGVLASKLGKDCLLVNAIVSTSYGAILQGIGSLACGIIIAFFASWRLALIALVGCPLIVLTGILESRMMMQGKTGSTKKKDQNLATDVRMFQETATNMKTVSAINCHKVFYQKYSKIVEAENNGLTWKCIKTGLLYGIGQSAMFVVYAVVFYAGAIFTYKYGLTFRDMFRALFGIIFAAYGAGMAQQFLPNMGQANNSIKDIYEIIDYENKIVFPVNGKKTPIKGKIEFRNVFFRYPGRENPVFRSLSFTILPNQNIAFAGPSGTGKSTIFSLLYRFYDIQKGQILIDDVDIKDYDIIHLRDSFGMVGQEPKLFNSSIEYNIKYNKKFDDKQMKESARIANASNFIESDELDHIPEVQILDPKEEEKNLKGEKEMDDGKGYKRGVGMKGSKLSGGQKQRVAIARTVIRRPKVYFFDEATSALDTESEKVVQDALNKISQGMTSLSIAHRISTIRDCDVIFVIAEGEVVEQGTYGQLMNTQGEFWKLNNEA